jgi:SAM-dependent methyltransferase
MKAFVREICPPIMWRAAASVAHRLSVARSAAHPDARATPGAEPPGSVQALDVYWTPMMADILERWGEGNAWADIQLLMADVSGTVLDIACGTGKVMEILERPGLEIHGCDISDMLVGKAVERGIARERLQVCDATQMPYRDGEFHYSYSIGSLEHFTEDGINKFIREASRVTSIASFHMVPTSRPGCEGWITATQSYFNQPISWWLPCFEANFARVRVLGSTWTDAISDGTWFLCYK